MTSFLDLPWPKINDYLMEVATARDLNQLLHLALLKIGNLIPFDQAGILGFIDTPGKIAYQETRGGSESVHRDFQQYYCWVMPRIGLDVVKVGMTDWYEYNNTEYVTDFIRPNKIRYSAGIAQFTVIGPGNLNLSMNRSPDFPRFSDSDLKTLEIVQGHLANYCDMLWLADPEKCFPDSTDIRSVFRVLTQREAEIAVFLCRRYSTEMIGSRLLISPLTVYKHIENIYTKMNVNSRKSLVKKLLGTEDTESK